MIETEFGVFQVQLQGVFWDAVEFLQAALSVAPE